MGTAYRFECPDCGYAADVCGDLSSGMSVALQTHLCNECHAVVDVVIGNPRDKFLNPESGVPDVGRCPDCGGGNVSPWPRSRPCPKCGARMKKTGREMLWD